MKIQFNEETRVGARDNNQDAFAHFITEDWCLFIVADGLGGHQRGEIASNAFCQTIVDLVPQFAKHILQNQESMMSLILNAAKLMRQQVLLQYPNVDSQTTMALVWLDARKVLTAHVGDSRIYRMDPHEIWRTPDHTPVQELFEKGLIGEDDFASHPMQNRLLKTINLYEDPQVDLFVQSPLQINETMLLCTDGFWNALTKKEIHSLASTQDLKTSLIQMIQNIEKNYPWSADNITVQALRLQENNKETQNK
ncbi:MAG: serine/threonine-protein phosphatase [Proteobacteria bacterium]|nr:serine/threonine-protein phosphatase [Pseudomonadota bacterium]